MKEGLTEIVFILDKSGSMGGLEKDTIGGYNAFIEKQKNADGEAFISTVFFSNESKVIHDRLPIDRIEPMDESQYFVGGSTALLDAIGGAIKHIGNVHKYAREEDVPEKTIVIITTDGMENSSRKYDYKKIKEMIERQQEKYNWEFLFLGANIDVIKEASKIGIRKERAVRYECDEKGTRLNFATLGSAMCKVRSGKVLEDNWCADIVEYENSKKR